jgi:hypothetical protein
MDKARAWLVSHKGFLAALLLAASLYLNGDKAAALATLGGAFSGGLKKLVAPTP